jgi:hypothetical protein
MDFEEINTVQIRDDGTRFNTNAFKKHIILQLTKALTLMVTSLSSNRFPAALLAFSLHVQAVNVKMK